MLAVGMAVIGMCELLALAYAGPSDFVLRAVLIGITALATVAALAGLAVARWRWLAVVSAFVVLGAFLLWWCGKTPTNQADWQSDASKLAYATFDGDAVTVHNVRNFDYRSETEQTAHWYEERFDMRDLQGGDLVASYWMGPAIAHTFVSFTFAGGRHLTVSIETRKKNGQQFSTLAGFFRKYELIYVVADERDTIRLRTNYRRDPPENVYLYRIKAPVDGIRRVFLQYMKRINELKKRPEFYNTLTSNCTTDIWFNTLVNVQHLPFSWKILASGYVPQYLYEQGKLDSTLPFPELQRRAQAADTAPDFSARIRAENPVNTKEATSF